MQNHQFASSLLIARRIGPTLCSKDDRECRTVRVENRYMKPKELPRLVLSFINKYRIEEDDGNGSMQWMTYVDTT
jgi:hypothetical protein